MKFIFLAVLLFSSKLYATTFPKDTIPMYAQLGLSKLDSAQINFRNDLFFKISPFPEIESYIIPDTNGLKLIYRFGMPKDDFSKHFLFQFDDLGKVQSSFVIAYVLGGRPQGFRLIKIFHYPIDKPELLPYKSEAEIFYVKGANKVLSVSTKASLLISVTNIPFIYSINEDDGKKQVIFSSDTRFSTFSPANTLNDFEKWFAIAVFDFVLDGVKDFKKIIIKYPDKQYEYPLDDPIFKNLHNWKNNTSKFETF